MAHQSQEIKISDILTNQEFKYQPGYFIYVSPLWCSGKLEQQRPCKYILADKYGGHIQAILFHKDFHSQNVFGKLQNPDLRAWFKLTCFKVQPIRKEEWTILRGQTKEIVIASTTMHDNASKIDCKELAYIPFNFKMLDKIDNGDDCTNDEIIDIIGYYAGVSEVLKTADGKYDYRRMDFHNSRGKSPKFTRQIVLFRQFVKGVKKNEVYAVLNLKVKEFQSRSGGSYKSLGTTGNTIFMKITNDTLFLLPPTYRPEEFVRCLLPKKRSCVKRASTNAKQDAVKFMKHEPKREIKEEREETRVKAQENLKEKQNGMQAHEILEQNVLNPGNITQEQEHIVPNPGQIVQKREHTAPNPGQIVQKREHTAPHPGQIVQKREHFVPSPEPSAQKPVQIVPNPGNITQNQEKSLLDPGNIDRKLDHIVQTLKDILHKQKIAQNQEDIAQKQEDIAQKQEDIAQKHELTVPNQCHIALKQHTGEKNPKNKEPKPSQPSIFSQNLANFSFQLSESKPQTSDYPKFSIFGSSISYENEQINKRASKEESPLKRKRNSNSNENRGIQRNFQGEEEIQEGSDSESQGKEDGDSESEGEEIPEDSDSESQTNDLLDEDLEEVSSEEEEKQYKKFNRLRVVIKNAEMHKDDDPNFCYTMRSKPRGGVLIINNYHYKSRKTSGGEFYREGGLLDVDMLTNLFSRFGFLISTHTDLKAEELPDVLDTFKDQFKDGDMDACIVVVLSHGADNIVIMRDEQPVELPRDIIHQFDSIGYKEMANKPKLFFIQACQDIPGKGLKSVLPKPTRRKPINLQNILEIKAAIPGTSAPRDPNVGSAFIYVLVKTLMNHAHELDLFLLLEQVQRELKEVSPENKLHCQWTPHEFNKKLYFNPGL